MLKLIPDDSYLNPLEIMETKGLLTGTNNLFIIFDEELLGYWISDNPIPSVEFARKEARKC